MLKCISVDRLELGMWIEELRGSWTDHPFWRDSFFLDNREDLERILASEVREVWIDTGKGLDVPAEGRAADDGDAMARDLPQPASSHKLPPPPPSRSRPSEPIHAELQRAAQICAEAKDTVLSMFQEARMGHAVDTRNAHQLVEQISQSINRNASALISMARLKKADDYTYMHSVAVCALMIALARQLGLDDRQTEAAGMAGLLHDVGKAKIPKEVLDKPGKLTEHEFAIMREHPAQGYDILREMRNLPPEALDVVLHHHEKMNGTGYPHGLKGEEISLYAKMGAVCDVYDAITSNRPYKNGWDPAESLHKMAEWAGGHFDQRVFQAFVKSVGIYPIGSLLRLNANNAGTPSGVMLGIVVDQSEQALTKPIIRAFYSVERDRRIPPQTFNLASADCPVRIVSRENPEQWNFPNLEKLWLEAA
ncbi:HD-GYP domain-containing protein [Hylemonella gracilis]|uniref:Metal dependent phosphohydrolase n=1 Tax=Hylemonella gracilis ATCC 19624 TaxID=887062 RepID=F3KPT1_9BURK|nr:HD-GYP domain-containing protein [Hylemonella gracilis]EGI78099.1 metal dependent phosphohydrolase [Hylemonella gracilis ATCC 19624]